MLAGDRAAQQQEMDVRRRLAEGRVIVAPVQHKTKQEGMDAPAPGPARLSFAPESDERRRPERPGVLRLRSAPILVFPVTIWQCLFYGI